MKKILNKKVLLSLLVLLMVFFTGMAIAFNASANAEVTEGKGTINVYLIGGQSNAVGYGADTNDVLVSEDSRFSTGFDNTIYYGEQERWLGNEQFTDFVPVKFGYGVGNGWLANVEDLRSGAEIGIAKALADSGEMNAVIKCAWGATNIYPDENSSLSYRLGTWTSPTYMQENDINSSEAKFGYMYSWFIDTVTTGISKLIEDGYVPVIKGMWWMQGEAEMFSTEMSSQYDELLRALIKDVRADVSAITGQDYSAMPFVFGLPSWNDSYTDAPPYENEVRTNMLTVANDATLLNVDCIDTEGLVQHDGWHFDAAGQRYLGETFISKLETLNETDNVISESISMVNQPIVRTDDNKGIKFVAKIANYRKANNYDYGMIIVPVDLITSNAITGDYVNAFNDNNIDIINLTCSVNHADVDGDGIIEDFIQGTITDVKYKNLNREFVGIAYIKDQNGNYLFTSSTVKDTISHLASELLLTLNSTDAEYDYIYSLANAGINQKNGVTEENANDVANFDLEVDSTLSVGYGLITTTKKINITQVPEINYAVSFTSSDTSVITVDQNGIVYPMQSTGSATITLKCFNVEKTITVTIDNLVVGEVVIDGQRDTAYGDFTEEVILDDDRYYNLSAYKNSEGVVIFAQGLFNTDISVDDSSDMSSNTNFEFKLNNGVQSYVMKNGSYSAITQYVYNVTQVSGKYLHTAEMFISKNLITNWSDTEEVQINYAWKTPTETAAIYDSMADYQYLSSWGNNSDWHSYHTLGCLATGFNSVPANLFISESGLKTTDIPTPFVINGVVSTEETALLGANQLSCTGGSTIGVKGTVVDGDLYLVITITHGTWSTYNSSWYLNDNFEYYINGKHGAIMFINGELCVSVDFDAGVATTTTSDTQQVTVIELYKKGNVDAYKLSINANGAGFGWNNISWGSGGEKTVYVTSTGIAVSSGDILLNGVTLDGNFSESIWSTEVKTNCLTVTTNTNGATVNIMGTKTADGIYFGFTITHTTAPTVSTNGSNNWYTYLNLEVHFNDSDAQFINCAVNNIANASSNKYSYAKTVQDGTTYTTTIEVFIPNDAVDTTSSQTSIDFTIGGWLETGWAEILRKSGWAATHTVSASGIVAK